MDEKESLLNRTDQNTSHVYTRRWWLLLVFAVSGFLQNVIWNTWGPIADSAKELFGWDNGQIGITGNLGNISYILMVFVVSYLMDKKGLRLSMLIGNGLVFVATGIRCITFIPKYATWLINVSAFLNGIALTVVMAGPPLLAAIWFPPSSRTTATAISSSSQFSGLAASFIIGPQLVSSPKYNTTSHTDNSSHLVTTQTRNSTYYNRTVLLNFNELKDDISHLMYYEFGVAGAILLATLLYFPDKPPTAPSYSASVDRIDPLRGLAKIIRMVPVWLISLACAIPVGVYGVWGSVLVIILNPLGVGQTEVGWIGFYATLAGSIAGLFIARFSDIFMKRMKLYLICLYLTGGGAFLWFTLINLKVINFSTVQLYASAIFGAMLTNTGLPLFYELTCETAYPIGEGVCGAFLTLLSNISGVLFLLVLQIPHIGTSWMNWTLLGSIVFGLMCLMIFPESYARTNLDLSIKKQTDITVDVQVSQEEH